MRMRMGLALLGALLMVSCAPNLVTQGRKLTDQARYEQARANVIDRMQREGAGQMRRLLSDPQHEVLSILAASYEPMTHEQIRQAKRVQKCPTATLKTLEARGLVHNTVPSGGRWWDGLVSITGAGAAVLMAEASRGCQA